MAMGKREIMFSASWSVLFGCFSMANDDPREGRARFSRPPAMLANGFEPTFVTGIFYTHKHFARANKAPYISINSSFQLREMQC